MRWAALLLVLVLAGAGTAGVWALTKSHNAQPEQVTACATEHGARVAQGEDGLGFARQDIRAGGLRIARRYRLGRDGAVLLRGSGYRILVIAGVRSPSLQARGLPLRLYRRTPEFTSVLTERDPIRTVDACARAAAR